MNVIHEAYTNGVSTRKIEKLAKSLGMDTYEHQYPTAIEVLEQGLEDSLQFYVFKRIDHRKISSTNILGGSIGKFRDEHQ